MYSKSSGSAAAPTVRAPFHAGSVSNLRSLGVHIAFLTLHVGIGTFRPVQEKEIEKHNALRDLFGLGRMRTSYQPARANGGRIIAVGTTSCRVLESVAADDGTVPACSGSTDIFIYPRL